ncbi:MAG: uncharacterized protein K0S79_2533 [Nitrospira sp.]|nr:uncharacterized protein [Nitrospira sp.]
MVGAILLMALLVVPVIVHAHDESAEKPSMTITGHGQIALAPDTAFVTLGTETIGKSVAEAQRQNRQVMNKVVERLRGLQIEQERIQTASFTVSPQYKPPPKRSADSAPAPPEIIAYIVSNNLTVEVRNLEKVGAVIEESLAAGANHFQALHWALRDEQQAKLSALKQAAAKAHEKATALSEALKVKLIRLMSATEDSHLVRPLPKVARSMMMEGGSEETPVFAGEIKIEATVTLHYEVGQD